MSLMRPPATLLRSELTDLRTNFLIDQQGGQSRRPHPRLRGQRTRSRSSHGASPLQPRRACRGTSTSSRPSTLVRMTHGASSTPCFGSLLFSGSLTRPHHAISHRGSGLTAMRWDVTARSSRGTPTTLFMMNGFDGRGETSTLRRTTPPAHSTSSPDAGPGTRLESWRACRSSRVERPPNAAGLLGIESGAALGVFGGYLSARGRSLLPAHRHVIALRT